MRHIAFALLLLLHFGLYGAGRPAAHAFSCARNVVWATPDSSVLTMDVYVPQTGRGQYPVVVIYHGGGWLINQKEIMDSLAGYLASHADYVVCNVNYRLLGDRGNSIKINQIVEDAFGALLWVKANIAAYNGDANRIAVTGDSAGGQLAAMVALCGNRLETDGFAGPSLGFNPTWLPQNVTADDLAQSGGVQVQAALLSYPAVDLYNMCQNGFETVGNPFWHLGKTKPRKLFGDTLTVKNQAALYQAVSPLYNIPAKATRLLPPQFCMVGTMDIITPPHTIKNYVKRCQEAGQPIELWRYKGRPHAFLDSKKNFFLGIDFTRDGPEAVDRMIRFLDNVFYADTATN